MSTKSVIDEEFFRTTKFCCKTLRNNVTLESNKTVGKVVMYDQAIRLFSIYVIDTPGAISPISFCPYCGNSLPKELSEERMKIIRKELGESFCWKNDEEYSEFEFRLPEEFKTDEWWKKRGL